tara:strand:+ start:19949 stop:20359 length:411 start_codon:yes stop_codon:yes gene_type:complete
MSTSVRLVVLIALAALAVWWFALRAEPETSGAALVDIVVPALPEPIRQGEALFNANCASCHGANAVGRDGLAPPLVHKFYEPNHHGDAAFQLAVQNGVRAHHWQFGNMPPVENITQDEVAQVTAYIRVLQRANGIH